MSLLIKNSSLKNDNKFIGEGSYGCVYYPGIDCKGKKNKKKTITKIQEINFYSENEKNIGAYIKKNIKKYKNFFSPVIKTCVVKFNTIEKSELNLKKCDTIFEDYNYLKNYYEKMSPKKNDEYNFFGENRKNLDSEIYNLKNSVDEQYYLMYVYFIKNKVFKEYYLDFSNYSNLVISLLNNFAYLLNSLRLLNVNKIVHNDLHVNNILINLKTNKPIIIDFGLSFLINKCYKFNKDYIDFHYLKNFTFDYRLDNYHVNIEKRFISFVIYNKTDYFKSDINDNNADNLLTKKNIDLFIKDCYESIISNDEIRYVFNQNELDEYKKSLEQFYYQFLNKTKYPKYNSIVKYLLDYVYAYNDLYSLTIDFIYISYSKKDLLEFANGDKENNYKILLRFFLQLYKKSLHPNPNMRLNLMETLEIYKFIVYYIKNVNINDNKYIGNFIIAFTKFLKSKSISIEIVFYKNFAFLDFNLICNKSIFEFIKSGF